METWFILAFIAQFMWSCNNLVDQFVARDYFEKAPLSFLCLGGLVCTTIAPVLLWWDPTSFDIPIETIILLLSTGLIGVIGIYPYIIALQEEDASLAIPIFQLIPFLVLIIAWVFLGETISMAQIIAGLIIILGSIGITLDLSTNKIKTRLLYLMSFSSFCLAIYIVILRYGASETSWLITTAWIIAGWGITGTAIFAFHKGTRNNVIRAVKQSKGGIVAFSYLQEFFDITALGFFSAAMAYAPAAVLVSLVGGTQPFIVIVLTGAFGYAFPRLFEKAEFDKNLAKKLLCSVVMFIGLYILLINS